MENVEFREALLNDLPQIIKLKIAMFKDSGHFDLLIENPYETILKDYTHLYKSKEAKHYLAIKDNKIVSCIGIFIKSDLPYRYYKNSKYGFIGDVYTIESERGKSLATKLTKISLDWFKENNITTIRLLASKQARKIYKKFGFKGTDEMSLKIKTYVLEEK